MVCSGHLHHKENLDRKSSTYIFYMLAESVMLEWYWRHAVVLKLSSLLAVNFSFLRQPSESENEKGQQCQIGPSRIHFFYVITAGVLACGLNGALGSGRIAAWAILFTCLQISWKGDSNVVKTNPDVVLGSDLSWGFNGGTPFLMALHVGFVKRGQWRSNSRPWEHEWTQALPIAFQPFWRFCSDWISWGSVIFFRQFKYCFQRHLVNIIKQFRLTICFLVDILEPCPIMFDHKARVIARSGDMWL